jgi:hypothetical protein
MLVAKIAGFIVVVIAIFAVIVEIFDKYNGYCKRRFGGSPFYPAAFLGVGLAGFTFWEGVLYYLDAVLKHKDMSDAFALLGLGGAGIALAWGICIKMTNVLHGTLITLTMLTVGTFLAPLTIMSTIGLIFGVLAGVEQVRCAGRRRFWEDW